jgi:hypothetical protein
MKRKSVVALFVASVMGVACGSSTKNPFHGIGGAAPTGGSAGATAGTTGGTAGGMAAMGGMPNGGAPTAGYSGAGRANGGTAAGGNSGSGGVAAGTSGGVSTGGAPVGGKAGTGGAGGNGAGGGIGGESGASAGGAGGNDSEHGFDCGTAARCDPGQVCVSCSVGTLTNGVHRCVPHPVDDPTDYEEAVDDCLTEPKYEECDGPEDCGSGEHCVAKAGNEGTMRCRSTPAEMDGSCCFACGALVDCTLCRTTTDCPDPQDECEPVQSGPAGLMGCQ